MQNLLVKKYGGSSLSNLQSIQAVAQNIAIEHKKHPLIVVVSAMGKETDELLQKAYTLSPSPKKRELDMLLTTGERISMSLLSIALNQLGCPAVSFTGSQAGILTCSKHSFAKITNLNPKRVREALNKNHVVILAGFQGVNPITKEVTTLGRGGSDTTAVSLAAHFQAPCEMFKSVEGIFSADPLQFKNAKQHQTLTYDEVFQMTKWGNPILHKSCLSLAKEKKVDLMIKKYSKNKDCPTKPSSTSLIFKRPSEQFQFLSIQSHLKLLRIKKKELSDYSNCIEKNALTSIDVLHENTTYFWAQGTQEELDILSHQLTNHDPLSSVTLVFNKKMPKNIKDSVFHNIEKKRFSFLEKVEEDLSLTLITRPQDRKNMFDYCFDTWLTRS